MEWQNVAVTGCEISYQATRNVLHCEMEKAPMLIIKHGGFSAKIEVLSLYNI